MQPTGRRNKRVSVQDPGVKDAESTIGGAVSGTVVSGGGGDVASVNAVPAMSEQTKLLYLSVSAGRAFPYVAQWMHSKADEMEGTVAQLSQTAQKTTMAAIDAKHEAVKTARKGHEKGRVKLTTELQMVQSVRDHQRNAGAAWLEAFRESAEACVAELLEMKKELHKRWAAIAEWIEGGGREEVLQKLTALRARHTVLQNLSERVVAREGLRREQTLQRMRETMDTLVGEVSEAVTWDMHQRLHGSRPVFSSSNQRGGAVTASEGDDDYAWLAETEDERIVRLEEAKLSRQLLIMRREKFERKRLQQEKRQQRLRIKIRADENEEVEDTLERGDGCVSAATPNVSEQKVPRIDMLPAVRPQSASSSTALPREKKLLTSAARHGGGSPSPLLPQLPTQSNNTETRNTASLGRRMDGPPTTEGGDGETSRHLHPSVRNQPFMFGESSAKETNNSSPSPVPAGVTARGETASPKWLDKAKKRPGPEDSGNYNENTGNKYTPTLTSKKSSRSPVQYTSGAHCILKQNVSNIKRPPIVLPPSISGRGVSERYNADHIATLLSALSEDKAHFAASKRSTQKEVRELQQKLRAQQEETARLFDNNVSLERQRAQLLAQREAQLIKLSVCKEKQVTEDETRNFDTELLNEGLTCTLDVVKHCMKQRLAEIAQVREAIDVFNAGIAERERKLQIVREYWRRNSKAFAQSEQRHSIQFGGATGSTLSGLSNTDASSPDAPRSVAASYRVGHVPGVQLSPKWTPAHRRSTVSYAASVSPSLVSGGDWGSTAQNDIPALGLCGFDVVSRFIQDIFDEIPLSDVPERLFIGHTR
ncbi:uncharacterized protein TEOVI_000528200 [Trypanosoma equiperdum]|uniref:Uncharacterized protein n=2 Tax=Trypanozoon TaxID=39700 RepID=Q57XR5_TRYB2|nr:hypothetical protein, conserved [Trypanosoma brucei brucei TREU927]AAX69603.1 hypothetical protein, conserved [Trypanosoma brucei]AAZ12756.1 hypothetical protein, conserved [Trypanosoma brucei brucei TREU927]SCU64520.1 hypothetical protein, conserved [Trypanosoma equiperdum]